VRRQGMLEVAWEVHASKLANAPDNGVQRALDEIAAAIGVSVSEGAARVLVARDTRPHSERLASLALDGVAHMGSACTGDDRGLLCARPPPPALAAASARATRGTRTLPASMSGTRTLPVPAPSQPL
jgi:phosphoacetylglucosamine mutase